MNFTVKYNVFHAEMKIIQTVHSTIPEILNDVVVNSFHTIILDHFGVGGLVCTMYCLLLMILCVKE